MTTPQVNGAADERDLLAYEMLTQRQLEHQSLTWQTPGLSLTAQAFLLTIAFGAGSTSVARVVSAAIGIVVGLLAMQLMDKHRILGALELLQLDGLEDRVRLPQVTHIDYAALAGSALRPYRQLPKWRFWHKLRSSIVWQVGLGCFVAANLLVLALVISGNSDVLASS